MQWKFNAEGDPYLDNTVHDDINIPNVNYNICATIKFLPSDKASKYLGHIKEAAGTQSKQESKLKSIIGKETVFVATS